LYVAEQWKHNVEQAWPGTDNCNSGQVCNGKAVGRTRDIKGLDIVGIRNIGGLENRPTSFTQEMCGADGQIVSTLTVARVNLYSAKLRVLFVKAGDIRKKDQVNIN
jgi:hypothetical protein